MPLGIRPTVDFVFKLLFGSVQNKDLLIHLLNAVLTPEHLIVDVEILNPYNEKDFEDDKLSIVDIKARDSLGAWYAIEIQTSMPSGLGNRLAFYTSELYAGQMREGDSYGDLRPAISICFLTESLFRDAPEGHLRFSLCDPVQNVSLGDQLQVHLIELSKYHIEEADLEHAEWLERWVYFLSDSANHDGDELRRLLPDSMFQKATEILEMIARNPELRLLYDDRAKEAKDRFSEIKDARAEGERIGKAEGERIGRIRTLEELLGLPISDQDSLSQLALSDLDKLAADLKQKLCDRI